jgi:hypothetical protein
MQTIQLTTNDLSRLKTHQPVYVDGTKFVIYGTNGLGIAQEGWTLIQLTDNDFSTLWNGIPIVVRNIKITPPLFQDPFIGYKGQKEYDISYVHTTYGPIQLNQRR